MDLKTIYGELDGLGLASLVRGGEVSPLDLVDEAIRRLEAVNGDLNAVVTRMFDHARQAAAGPPPDGPFAGVPFLMKDFLAEVAGHPLHEGSAFLDGFIPDEDSEIYRRFVRAGLIAFGKTNLPEMAIGATTEPLKFGPSRNPWNLARTPGGSSGGAAAAVAARVVPMAHGNDVGGSIRIPASCCGLVGLKPTRARITLAPRYGDLFAGFLAEGALTRSVRDTAALLDAVAGPEAGEPYAPPPPERPWLQEVGADPGRLRIGFSVATPLGDPLDPECRAAVEAAAALCEACGHDVVDAAPDFDAMAMWSRYTDVLAAGVAWALADWSRRLDKPLDEARFEPFVWAFAERGRALSAADLLLAVQDVQLQVRRAARFFEDHHLWLTPTLGQPPVSLGALSYAGDPVELRRRSAAFNPFNFLANASGQPAISLPLHESGDGLPIGVMFTGRYGDEATLLRLSAQLEEARPWASRRPPVCSG
ncbi:MAG: amidase family protein [Pseudomonadota bacterium]